MLHNFFFILSPLTMMMMTMAASVGAMDDWPHWNTAEYIERIDYNDPAAEFIREGGGGSMEVDWNEVGSQ